MFGRKLSIVCQKFFSINKNSAAANGISAEISIQILFKAKICNFYNCDLRQTLAIVVLNLFKFHIKYCHLEKYAALTNLIFILKKPFYMWSTLIFPFKIKPVLYLV